MQEELKKLLKKWQLEEYEEIILAQSAETVALFPEAKADHEIPKAACKIGGSPDLPVDFDWPYFKNKPLRFVLQINLRELPVLDQSVLPEQGLLSLFYCEEVWGFDIKNKDGFKVCFFPSISGLERRKAPIENAEKKVFFGLFKPKDRAPEYKSAALKLRSFLSLPYDPDKFSMPEDDAESYFEMLEDMGNHHRLFGYAEPIQGPMELECQLVTNGISCGAAVNKNDPRVKELEAGQANWRLLLQLDSECENSDMLWGDAGRLYLWIKKDDLAEGKFERSWLISQCY